MLSSVNRARVEIGGNGTEQKFGKQDFHRESRT